MKDILLYGDDERRADYFRKVMDKEIYASTKYEEARLIYSFFCKKIRAKDRLTTESYR